MSTEQRPPESTFCKENKDGRYLLAPGVQVREEDFGLLFYQMSGPRLYFLSSGELLKPRFFEGRQTPKQWVGAMPHQEDFLENRLSLIARVLDRLVGKGLILEC